MTFSRRTSFVFYVAWMLFESLASFLYILPPGLGHYGGIDISFLCIVSLLLFSVWSHGLKEINLANFYLNGLVMAHQLCLMSIALCNLFFGSLQQRIWYGFRISLIAICILLNLRYGVERTLQVFH